MFPERYGSLTFLDNACLGCAVCWVFTAVLASLCWTEMLYIQTAGESCSLPFSDYLLVAGGVIHSPAPLRGAFMTCVG